MTCTCACHNTQPENFTCCGQPMIWQEVFGIRRYQCRHRSHHPVIYVNQQTGETVPDEDIPWQGQ